MSTVSLEHLLKVFRPCVCMFVECVSELWGASRTIGVDASNILCLSAYHASYLDQFKYPEGPAPLTVYFGGAGDGRHVLATLADIDKKLDDVVASGRYLRCRADDAGSNKCLIRHTRGVFLFYLACVSMAGNRCHHR